ncbi:MAG: hypothetical protein WBV21_07660, partial [Desulfobacterales bacterium]
MIHLRQKQVVVIFFAVVFLFGTTAMALAQTMGGNMGNDAGSKGANTGNMGNNMGQTGNHMGSSSNSPGSSMGSGM